MRKLISILVVIVMFALMIPTSFADAGVELEQAIINAVATGQRVDLSGFAVKDDEFSAICTMLYQTGRLPWYAEHSFEWTATEDGTIVEFVPKTLDAYGYDRDLYEQKVSELIFETCRDGMADWQKALAVHDHIAVHVAYDMTQNNNTAYTALVQGSSACAGYAQLYMDVMRRLDIPCQIAECDDTGDGIGHAWNMIRLEGEWYHVDVTWDDATPDVYGRVLHEHFLKTDSQFKTADNGHNFGWTAYTSCNGGKYSSGMPWEGVESAVCMDDSGMLYINKSKEGVNRIVRVDPAGFGEVELYAGEQVVLNLGEGDALYPTMGLTLVGERLCFNSPKDVLSVALDGSDMRVEYTLSSADQFIMGSFIERGVASLTIANHAMELETADASVSVADGHTHSYVENGRVEASCESGAGALMACQCGASYIADMSAPLSHQLELSGNTYTCRDCGYSFDKAEVQKVNADSGLGIWLWIGLGAVGLIVIVLIVGKKKR